MPDTVIKDAKAPIVATGRLKANLTLPASDPELSTGYTIDFGEHEFTIKPGGDIKELWSASGGTLGKYKKRRVKPTLAYEADLKFLPKEILQYIFGTSANTGGVPNPGKVIELYCWIGLEMEGETVVTAGTNEGEGIFVHHSFLAAMTFDGDLDAKGEEFMSCKLTADVLLGRAKGTVAFGTRPITQAA